MPHYTIELTGRAITALLIAAFVGGFCFGFFIAHAAG
jgi:hypothetical protein